MHSGKSAQTGRTRSEPVDWSKLRAPATAQDTVLAQATQVWLDALPSTVRPSELPRRFPRIANRLAALWRRPVQADAYFDELLVDKRGDRQGFPLPVVMELVTLKSYYQTQVYPLRAGLWDRPGYRG